MACAIVGDFGAGENPWLREYTQSQDGLYVAVDYRKPPLTEQRRGGALTVRTRLQELPVPLHRDVEGGLDIVRHKLTTQKTNHTICPKILEGASNFFVWTSDCSKLSYAPTNNSVDKDSNNCTYL